MKVSVDLDKCQGHAVCGAYGPDVYELDDSGYCAITELIVPADLKEQAKAGADACPEQAITLS